MKNALRIILALTLIAATLTTRAEVIEDKPSVGAMVADALIIRPIYFVMSQLGALAYTVTLPFTLMGGNTDEAAETMVITPLQATFIRCLGCGSIPTQVDLLERGFGKEITHFVELSGGISNMSMTGTSADASAFGIAAGTHFALVGGSRFDIMLGASPLGAFEFTDSNGKVTDTINSYHIVTRFGREMFYNTAWMMKFGLNNWSVSRESTAGDATIDGYGFLYGIGVDTKWTRMFHSGLEFTRYELNSDEYSYKSAVNAATVNLSVHF